MSKGIEIEGKGSVRVDVRGDMVGGDQHKGGSAAGVEAPVPGEAVQEKPQSPDVQEARLGAIAAAFAAIRALIGRLLL